MGGSGGGGGSFYGPSSAGFQKKVEYLRERERERFVGEVNDYLQHLLAVFNDRDVESRKEKLAAITSLLSDVVEVDSVLLGGSVAKHTDVNGLSDVDALVILDRDAHRDESPGELLREFEKKCNRDLPRSEVESVRRGTLAVTVLYRDGTEVQLLPALRSRQTISIPSADGNQWNDTKPRVFQRELNRANERLNQSLVPTIKLAKAVNDGLPEQRRLTGYHLEALALESAKTHDGPKIPRSLLLHVLDHASNRVLQPMRDVTGQSRTIDDYLGAANSAQRRGISQALTALKRQLESARSLGEWKAVFKES